MANNAVLHGHEARVGLTRNWALVAHSIRLALVNLLVATDFLIFAKAASAGNAVGSEPRPHGSFTQVVRLMHSPPLTTFGQLTSTIGMNWNGALIVLTWFSVT